jgi:RES domain-containing protein
MSLWRIAAPRKYLTRTRASPSRYAGARWDARWRQVAGCALRASLRAARSFVGAHERAEEVEEHVLDVPRVHPVALRGRPGGQ